MSKAVSLGAVHTHTHTSNFIKNIKGCKVFISNIKNIRAIINCPFKIQKIGKLYYVKST